MIQVEYFIISVTAWLQMILARCLVSIVAHNENCQWVFPSNDGLYDTCLKVCVALSIWTLAFHSTLWPLRYKQFGRQTWSEDLLYNSFRVYPTPSFCLLLLLVSCQNTACCVHRIDISFSHAMRHFYLLWSQTPQRDRYSPHLFTHTTHGT